MKVGHFQKWEKVQSASELVVANRQACEDTEDMVRGRSINQERFTDLWKGE